MPLGKGIDSLLGDYFGTAENIKKAVKNPIPNLNQDKDEIQNITTSQENNLENQNSEAVGIIERIENDFELDLKKITTADSNSVVKEIEISKIRLSTFQTRSFFDQTKIQSLAESIKENGLIHPVVVITLENSVDGFGYMLLTGERRLKACQLLGYTHIQAIIRPAKSLSDKQQALITAIENLQREDLSPLELSFTFKMLMQTQGLDEKNLAVLLGHSEQYVRNYLRLLSLSTEVKKALLENKIGEGQARHLVGLDENIQNSLLVKILENKLTVKEIEMVVKTTINNELAKPAIKTVSKFHQIPPEIYKKADKLAESIPNAKLKCLGNEKKGKIIISW